MEERKYDYDYIVIGSGFGGSVSAMRLAQKGYKVAVLESGKRWKSPEHPKTNFNIRKFLWMPNLFCYGIQRLNLLNDVLILSGAGVGGGSLVYANTLYVPPQKFFDQEIVKSMGGKDELLPFYEIAQKMLGVVENPKIWEVDEYMKQTAAEFGVEHTFKKTPVGINFHDKDKEDPYFNGEGPLRDGCNFCGGCMIGCRNNAKNTLDKNYLYFAEKLGVYVIPETKAVEVKPLSEDGSEGYEIRTRTTTGLFGFPKRKFTAKGVVFSAGVLGTMGLLMKMKEKKTLPKLSSMLGKIVRTNSESILGVTALDSKADFSKGIAITSSIYPDEHTHIEPVRYPAGSDAMAALAVNTLVDGGGKVPRQFRFLISFVSSFIRHPLRNLRFLIPYGFAKRSIILLVMQTVDNSIDIVRKRRLIWPFWKTLSSKQKTGEKIPTYIPIANEFARKLAKRINGVARSSINEVLLDVPTTAHILGGAIIGETENQGVVDLQNRVFGYKNMIVCDGSMVPANLGVNPSLTITALSERAMSYVPPKEGKEQKFFQYEKSWSITGVLKRAKTPVQIPVKTETVNVTDNKKTKEKKKAVSKSRTKTVSKSKSRKK